jgi:adenylate cyclase
MQMRRRLATGAGSNEFPLLAELAAEGATDYWARIIMFDDRGRIGDTRGLATSWATREPGGFGTRDLALIEATLPALALAYKATLAIETARVLVTTYVGHEAAERILRGEIDRGQVRTVPTVLWFSDLIGFTRIADTLPRAQLLDLLNAYAECLVGVVHAHGGEVLKFMGDGILAVFSGARAEACRRALDAAEAARAAVARLNRERTAAGLPVTGFTLALHEGEVLSGNVGSRDRLDFTVIGPAVNELSRIQAMSRSLDQPVLVSARFAAACGDQRARLVSVGRYALRGVGRPQELFTLDLARPDQVDP